MSDNVWDIYSSYIGQHGFTDRDRIINETKEVYIEKIQHSPSFHTVDVDGETMSLQINSTQQNNKKTFCTMPDERVSLGQIVTWNDMHWLVTEIDFDDTLYLTGTIEQCNRQIIWQNQQTGEIIKRWCVATKPYYSNLSEDKTVTISTREFKIMLPYDDESILVDLDRRLLLEKINNHPKAYKITSVDSVTNRYEDLEETGSGFLVWNVTQDQFDANKDNAELMVADYIEFTNLGSNNDESISVTKCVIEGVNYIKAGIGSRTYICNCFDNNEIVDKKINWEVQCEKDDFTSYIHADAEGNRLTLKVDSVKGIIGSEIKLIATCDDPNYEKDIFILEVKGIYE